MNILNIREARKVSPVKGIRLQSKDLNLHTSTDQDI